MKSRIIIVLLCLITPHLIGQQTENTGEPTFVAHRGASHLAPENTLASINLAWELGAGAAECDVRLSSDNKVFLLHDKNTKKLCGVSHEVKNTPWKVLCELQVILTESNRPEYEGEKIPLLRDVLATVPEERTLVIEIKTGPEILPHLKKVVDDHWKSGKIAFIAFDFETIVQAKAIYPDVPCYYLSMIAADVKKHLRPASEKGLDGLNLRYSIINEKLVEKCKNAGLDLWCWTVNDPETAARMKELGVTAITTDRPAWLKKALVKS